MKPAQLASSVTSRAKAARDDKRSRARATRCTHSDAPRKRSRRGEGRVSRRRACSFRGSGARAGARGVAAGCVFEALCFRLRLRSNAGVVRR